MNLKSFLQNPNASAMLRELHAQGELESMIPELAALDISDHVSHLHKNNFDHSLKVLDNARSIAGSEDVILLTAALFHDIGKPATRKIKGRQATFVMHESVGAKQVRALLRRFDYSSAEIKLVSELILNHMRAYGFSKVEWTDSAVRRFMTDLSSEEQLQRLLVIFRSDLTTKNEKLRRSVLNGIDELERRLAEVKAKDARAARRPSVNGDEIMEIFDLKPGRLVGAVMRYLNSDEGLELSREEALAKAAEIIAEQ